MVLGLVALLLLAPLSSAFARGHSGEFPRGRPPSKPCGHYQEGKGASHKGG